MSARFPPSRSVDTTRRPIDGKKNTNIFTVTTRARTDGVGIAVRTADSGRGLTRRAGIVLLITAGARDDRYAQH